LKLKLALIVFILFASTVLASGVSDAVSPYFYAGEDVEYIPFTLTGGYTYSVVEIDGRETFLVDSSSGYSIVTGREEINEVLMDYYSSGAFTNSLVNVDNAVTTFRNRKAPGESKCFKDFGMDREEHSCFDHESCYQSCISVPHCRSQAVGMGEPFIIELSNFTNNTNRINENLEYVEYTMDAIRNGTGTELMVEESILSLQEVKELALVVSASSLANDCLTCISYCDEISYDLGVIDAAITELESIKDDMGNIEDTGRLASLMAARTSARLEAGSLGTPRDELYSLVAQMGVKDAQLDSSYSEFSSKVSDEEVGDWVSYLNGLRAEAEATQQTGEYEIGAAKAREYLVLADEVMLQAAVIQQPYEEMREEEAAAEQNLAYASSRLRPHDTELQPVFNSLTGSLDQLQDDSANPVNSSQVAGFLANYSQLASDSEQLLNDLTNKRNAESNLLMANMEIAAYSSEATDYHQNLSKIDDVKDYVSRAQASMSAGSYYYAESNSSAALDLIKQKQGELNQTMAKIDDASAQINDTKEKLAEANSRVYLFFYKPDMAEAELLVTQAEAALYDDPETAINLAWQADGTIDAKLIIYEESKQYILPVVAGVTIVLLIIGFALSTAFFGGAIFMKMLKR